MGRTDKRGVVPAGGLIVSCQADAGTPLAGPEGIALLARAALAGGAQGIRADSPGNVRAIRSRADCLIVGSFKIRTSRTPVFVTPTFDAAREVIEAGADIIGIQATREPLADAGTTYDLIRRIKEELGARVMADASVIEEAVAAQAAGADYVTSALAGCTPHSRRMDGPDLDLVAEMAEALDVPVVAEGRIRTPREAREALERGAHAVVVGTAITDPLKTTGRFLQIMGCRPEE